MNATGRQSDERTRNYLVAILVECGENREHLERLSLLELIDVATEKCLFEVGQFLCFVKTVLTTHASTCDMLSARLERSEEELAKLRKRLDDTREALLASEREQAVLNHLLSVAHQHPGLEALRRFLASFKCESCLDDLLEAGIDSIELLKEAARRKHGLKKAGINVDIAALIRRHLRAH